VIDGVFDESRFLGACSNSGLASYKDYHFLVQKRT
jgi:hypothetical protein